MVLRNQIRSNHHLKWNFNMTASAIVIPLCPCIKCGATERDKRGKCKACLKVRTTAWRAANPEKERARRAAWRAANPEKAKAATDAWRDANPDKQKASRAAWRESNSEKLKADIAAWRKANSEKVKADTAAWRATNPEKVKAAATAWRDANPESGKIHKQNRRARKNASGGNLSHSLPAKLFKLQKGLCPCCKQPLGKNYHLDHITPLALGGANEDWNMQLLRKICNLQKHAKHPVDFMQSRGFLL